LSGFFFETYLVSIAILIFAEISVIAALSAIAFFIVAGLAHVGARRWPAE
jgi:hypothetical protein